MVKVFLHISREEQKQRFLDRMELSEKYWKLSVGDMKERALWKEYDEAYEKSINATATRNAPWYVLPADDKWYTRYLMSEILVKTLSMRPDKLQTITAQNFRDLARDFHVELPEKFLFD